MLNVLVWPFASAVSAKTRISCRIMTRDRDRKNNCIAPCSLLISIAKYAKIAAIIPRARIAGKLSPPVSSSVVQE